MLLACAQEMVSLMSPGEDEVLQELAMLSSIPGLTDCRSSKLSRELVPSSLCCGR